jgi:hypothetical protein
LSRVSQLSKLAFTLAEAGIVGTGLIGSRIALGRINKHLDRKYKRDNNSSNKLSRGTKIGIGSGVAFGTLVPSILNRDFSREKLIQLALLGGFYGVGGGLLGSNISQLTKLRKERKIK